MRNELQTTSSAGTSSSGHNTHVNVAAELCKILNDASLQEKSALGLV